jgi:hypothetical protein
MTRSEIRTMLKRFGFKVNKYFVHYVQRTKPTFVSYNMMNFMKSEGAHVILNDRYYRFGKDKTGQWVVDVSCVMQKFDRWANSRHFDKVPIEMFAQVFKNLSLKDDPVAYEASMDEVFTNYRGVDYSM